MVDARWIAGMALAASAACSAADAGPTWPLGAYLAERLPEGASTSLVSDAASTFPVNPGRLRVGRLPAPGRLPLSVLRWLDQPLALVGDDPLSRAWLGQHGDHLLQQHAQILVVSVEDAQHLRALRRVRADLPMAAGEAHGLDAALVTAGVGVYPILIGRDGRVTQALPRARDPQPEGVR